MELLTNKKITRKIIIALVVTILFNFISPQISFGKEDENKLGGILFEPIKDLLLTLSDGVVWIIQKVIFGTNASLLKLIHPDAAASAPLAGAGAGSIAALIASFFVPGGPLIWLSIGAVGLATGIAVTYIATQFLPETFYLPLYGISPAEIVSGKIALLDVNFFNPNTYENYTTVVGTEGNEQKSTAAILQGVISQWYFTIRNFAIVILLAVLIYMGIKIVISSSNQDKAKYKQRLIDWIIAMCLLFFLHYIMTTSVTITQLITNSLDFLNKDSYVIIRRLRE